MSDTLITKAAERASWMLVIRGIVAIIFGVIVAVWPTSTLLVIVWLFGIFAVIDGIVGVVHWIADRADRTGWDLAGSIISIVAGLIAIIWPGPTVLAMTFLIGFWAILLGASQIAIAVRSRKLTPSWWIWLVTGIITLVFGFVLVLAPGVGILSVLWLLSLFAILEGILLILLGIVLRRVSRESAHLAD